MNIYNYELYIFDLDGVIINSEYKHFESYKEAFNDNLKYEDYCRINHSIDKENSFKYLLKDKYDDIYKRKRDIYNTKIKDIELVKGINNFIHKLIIKGKIIVLVTDSSKHTLQKLMNKFSILYNFHYIVTRDDVTNRKPSNEGYLKVLKKYKHIDHSSIIGFEDSYKGICAMSSVIYNTVLINNKSYYYYETILPLLNIKPIIDFENIDNYIITGYNNNNKFYISSKTKHSNKWKMIKPFFNITSRWIDVNKSKEQMDSQLKGNICSIIYEDIKNCDYLLFYSEDDEYEHYGSLLEIGIALSLGKKIYICGSDNYQNEVVLHFDSINSKYLNTYNLSEIIYKLNLENTEKYIKHYKKIINLCNKDMVDSVNISTNYILDYVVISASGRGSRLLPITAHIPKLLVSFNNNCLLNNIINYWKNYCKKFIVIINSKYNSIVQFYLDLYRVNYEIINVELVDNYENSYTLAQALKDEKFLNKKILITWCDIYPNIPIDKTQFGDDNIIFTYKNYGRYEAVNNKLIKKSYGNVIGIYYFSKFNFLLDYEPTMDLCDCYKKNFGDFKTFEIEDLIDIGDMDKLILFLNKKNVEYVTRYFNKITELDDERLLKESTCDYGNIIINNECCFYRYHNTFKYIPKIYEYGNNYFIMHKIPHSQQAICVFNKSLQSKQFDIIKNCLMMVENLHNCNEFRVEKNILLRDIKKEFQSKIFNRLNLITPILEYFSFIKSVNKVNIKISARSIIDELSKEIIDFFKKNIKKYKTIHGDCHLSNILIDRDDNYYLIDPRGYFGDSKIYGIDYYDIGKILYSLSGFDELNNRKNHYFIIKDDDIIVNINNNMDNYLFLFEKYNKKILINMVILHWFGLAEYSKSNIHKCISAYYFGIYLYYKYCLK